MKAPRAWPMCTGPVGFAETNSTMTRLPVDFGACRPNVSPARSTSAATCWMTCCFSVKLRKPGPATSTFSMMPAVSTSPFTMAFAMSRGGLPSGFVSSIATLTAQSPWATFFGGSTV